MTIDMTKAVKGATVHVLPDTEVMHRLFKYENGILYWKVSRTNAIKVGDEAGCVNGRGYKEVRIDGVLYRVHRLIWKMHYGSDPKRFIDHINMNKTDNRIENLRDVTRSQNEINKKRSAPVGVNWSKSKNKWVSRIKRNGKTYSCGNFKCYGAALMARKNYDIEVPA